MTRKDNTNFDYNEEVKRCKTIDDVLGKNGLVQRLVKDVLENILEAEGAKFWLSICNDLKNITGKPNFQ